MDADTWKSTTKALVDFALGRMPADLVVQGGRWVCVQLGEGIPETDVAFVAGRVAYVGLDAKHDERAEILEPANDSRLPRRQAHYVTLRFEGGKTAHGVPVSVTDKYRVLVSGYLRDSAYAESLRESLRKAQKIDGIADGDDDVRVGRVPTYVVVRSLVRFTPR